MDRRDPLLLGDPDCAVGVPSLRKQGLHWAAPLVVVLGVGMNRFNATLAAQFAPEGAVYSARRWNGRRPWASSPPPC
ncbi:MAG: hypothetical protein R2856_20050 [Caldilineaceae bacterium]